MGDSSLAWLKHNAPDESARPWSPIETMLPDPDLLQPAPPFYLRVGDIASWMAKHPVECVCYVAGASLLVGTVTLALAPLFLWGYGGCKVGLFVRLLLTLFSLNALNLLVARYKLYHLALHYQLEKGVSLGAIASLRLKFRSARFTAAAGLAIAAALLYWRCSAMDTATTAEEEAGNCDPLCCSPTNDAARSTELLWRQLLLTLVSIPFVHAALHRFANDPVEDAAVKERLAQPHQHSSS